MDNQNYHSNRRLPSYSSLAMGAAALLFISAGFWKVKSTVDFYEEKRKALESPVVANEPQCVDTTKQLEDQQNQIRILNAELEKEKTLTKKLYEYFESSEKYTKILESEVNEAKPLIPRRKSVPFESAKIAEPKPEPKPTEIIKVAEPEPKPTESVRVEKSRNRWCFQYKNQADDYVSQFCSYTLDECNHFLSRVPNPISTCRENKKLYELLH